jgi:hypothetical protein
MALGSLLVLPKIYRSVAVSYGALRADGKGLLMPTFLELIA